ncbi:hypothetical protein RIEPE_0295 [Candidatus Riesia pediculicola USDA]|uniref:Uncharacterized protein n=1 Tax=Riesia pediculicola (strain USDA) TaxID=515618 RepID=D4G890_RIEPU|nr:hypothetical protein RIEPE_0295 [Candidatus Riesia pediculicola USDA]
MKKKLLKLSNMSYIKKLRCFLKKKFQKVLFIYFQSKLNQKKKYISSKIRSDKTL